MAKRTHSNASFTWTPGGSGETIVHAEGFIVGLDEIGYEAEDATAWGSTMQQMAVSQILKAGRITIGVYGKTTDATPPLPTGVQGTLLVTLDSGNTYSIPGKIVGLSIQMTNRTPAMPQMYLYDIVLHADAGTLASLVVT